MNCQEKGWGINRIIKCFIRFSVKKGVLKNFAKFKDKDLCQSLSFKKVVVLGCATLLRKRLWNRCFPVNFAKFLRTSLLYRTPPLAASVYTPWKYQKTESSLIISQGTGREYWLNWSFYLMANTSWSILQCNLEEQPFCLSTKLKLPITIWFMQ